MTQTARGAVTPPVARPTSMFVNGHFPRRRALVIGLSALAGFLLTVVWSAEFVDRTIGDNVANTMLGHEVRDRPIDGVVAGIAFAFVTGIAGTFTACNVAVFGALAPLVGQTTTARGRMLSMLRPLGWLSAGMITVSALYGVVVALVGTRMPQFQTASPATGFSPRLVQAMIVFGIIGVVLIWLGLAALGVLPDPLARVSARFPNAPMVLMGALIGGFLIGRPFALFRQMFRDAAESGNVLYGAVAFSLQSLGNIVVMALLFLLMAALAGDRLRGWLAADPRRATVLVAAAFLVAGVFTLLYWDVRILARRDLIWYPVAPWA
ncbi:hypothetical protein [Thermomonospora amylolytica]|uniref:hypothetical protein n=1 Tax=Thermomonospora amylolytica TaxID=1411117 RepID=UPI000E6C1FB4|nr:hypothetical protein [Thermomonospora amylolytica]